MKGRVIDGIVWVAIGACLIAQACFLTAISWMPSDKPLPSDGVPPAVAGSIVAVLFAAVGSVAFGMGVRRLLTVRRAG